jgi:hypothetical protein
MNLSVFIRVNLLALSGAEGWLQLAGGLFFDGFGDGEGEAVGVGV